MKNTQKTNLKTGGADTISMPMAHSQYEDDFDISQSKPNKKLEDDLIPIDLGKEQFELLKVKNSSKFINAFIDSYFSIK